MKRKQPSNMFTIMRLLVSPPDRYDDGMYRVYPRYIVMLKSNPIWKDQPERNDSNWYWHEHDWPIISKDCLKRLLKKGWLKEIHPKCWIASDLGKEQYRSIAPCFRRFVRNTAKPSLSKYRRRKLKAAKREAYWAERRKPEPEPQPVRKERKSVKFRHDGYRRHVHKNWLQEELS